MPRTTYPNELKVTALTRLIQDNEPISSICEDLKIPPTTLLQWRASVVDDLASIFDRSLKKEKRASERRVAALENEVKKKTEVIGELLEAYTNLKKNFGEN